VFQIRDILVRIRGFVPEDADKKTIFFSYFLLITFQGIFISLVEDKNHKKSQTSRYKGFSFYFCLVMEGSGAGSEPFD